MNKVVTAARLMLLTLLDLRRSTPTMDRVQDSAGEGMAMIRRMGIYGIVLCSLLIAAATATAQYPRYVPPSGRTLPNELNYFRRDVGLLDQYNTFVNPFRQLDNQLRTMQQQTRTDFQSAEKQISKIRTSQAAPTGVGAGYMNYSHYYNLPSSSGNAAPRSR